MHHLLDLASIIVLLCCFLMIFVSIDKRLAIVEKALTFIIVAGILVIASLAALLFIKMLTN